MKIREIRIKDFKRFSDTTVSDVPETAKLVLIAGPNGCGKSSLIEAVHTWHWRMGRRQNHWDDSYHKKQTEGSTGDASNSVALEFFDPQPTTPDERKRAVYIRSAYRNEPEFALDHLQKVGSALDESRIARLIDNDQAVSANYRRLVSNGFSELYESPNADTTFAEYRQKSIGSIREAMEKLFPGLVLNSLGNPLNKGTFKFDKGDSRGFQYKNLSGGEKAAFDLLLDIIIKKDEFNDTVFFIDEPEAHLSPTLQGLLLDSLLGLVPESSQIWLATHAIGMMRRAREISVEKPGSVTFLDFDGINFDVPQIVKPVLPDRPFWKRAMQIALDELAGYLAPEHIILCEGRSTKGRDFDGPCYNAIFSAEFPNVLFLSVGSSDDVSTDPRGIAGVVKALAPGVKVDKLIDRDDRTDDEIADLSRRGVRVLTLRTIESYLLSDSVLRRLCEKLGDVNLGDPLIARKQESLARSIEAGGPADDLKRVAGDVYLASKALFPGVKLGSDSRAFMQGLCAPLVPNSEEYKTLRQDIFGTPT
jgi:hypothetical protein